MHVSRADLQRAEVQPFARVLSSSAHYKNRHSLLGLPQSFCRGPISFGHSTVRIYCIEFLFKLSKMYCIELAHCKADGIHSLWQERPFWSSTDRTASPCILFSQHSVVATEKGLHSLQQHCRLNRASNLTDSTYQKQRKNKKMTFWNLTLCDVGTDF